MIKQDIISRALSEIGVANYIYDLSYDELNSCLNRLDTMVSEWGSRGIHVSYLLHEDMSDSSLTDEIEVPQSSFDAIAYNLAVKISGGLFGVDISPELSAKAKISYDSLRGRNSYPIEVVPDPSFVPSGQGNNWYGSYGSSTYNNYTYNFYPYISLGGNSLLDFY